jgi:hypothetical protein
MTNEIMSNEDFYTNTATVLMAAYNEDPSMADEIGLKLVNDRFEDSAERTHAINKIASIVADSFRAVVDEAQDAPMTDSEPTATPTEQLPLDMEEPPVAGSNEDA